MVRRTTPNIWLMDSSISVVVDCIERGMLIKTVLKDAVKSVNRFSFIVSLSPKYCIFAKQNICCILIGSKLSFRFCAKCKKEISVRLKMNKRVFFTANIGCYKNICRFRLELIHGTNHEYFYVA